MGISPSGQKIKWNEIIVTRFDNNKIREEWVVSELAGYLLAKPPLKEAVALLAKGSKKARRKPLARTRKVIE